MMVTIPGYGDGTMDTKVTSIDKNPTARVGDGGIPRLPIIPPDEPQKDQPEEQMDQPNPNTVEICTETTNTSSPPRRRSSRSATKPDPVYFPEMAVLDAVLVSSPAAALPPNLPLTTSAPVPKLPTTTAKKASKPSTSFAKKDASKNGNKSITTFFVRPKKEQAQSEPEPEIESLTIQEQPQISEDVIIVSEKVTKEQSIVIKDDNPKKVHPFFARPRSKSQEILPTVSLDSDPFVPSTLTSSATTPATTTTSAKPPKKVASIFLPRKAKEKQPQPPPQPIQIDHNLSSDIDEATYRAIEAAQRSFEASKNLRKEVEDRNKEIGQFWKGTAVNPFFTKKYVAAAAVSNENGGNTGGNVVLDVNSLPDAAWPSEWNLHVRQGIVERDAPVQSNLAFARKEVISASATQPSLNDMFLEMAQRFHHFESLQLSSQPVVQPPQQQQPMTASSLSTLFKTHTNKFITLTTQDLQSYLSRIIPSLTNSTLFKRILEQPLNSETASLLWVDKYSPTSCSDILANQDHVAFIQKWLQDWKVVTKTTSSNNAAKKPTKPKPKKKKKKRSYYEDAFSSDLDDFIIDDYDEDDDYFHNSDSEQENIGLKSHLLLHGPIASLKSTTLYTLAAENGYQVFEMHAGQKRAGKDVVGVVGEMSVSHLVRGSGWKRDEEVIAEEVIVVEDPKPKGKKKDTKTKAKAKAKKRSSKRKRVIADSEGEGENDSDEDVILVDDDEDGMDMDDLDILNDDSLKKRGSRAKRSTKDLAPDDSNLQSPTKLKKIKLVVSPTKVSSPGLGAIPEEEKIVTSITIEDDGRARAQSLPPQQPAQPKQSLILMEEVDILYDADKGFWNAVVELMEKSKRPIVMTTNDIVLHPSNTSIQSPILLSPECPITILNFTKPDIESVAGYLLLVLLNEGYFVDLRELIALAKIMDGDLRKCLNALQFWSCSVRQFADYSSGVSRIRLQTDDNMEHSGLREFLVTKLDLSSIVLGIVRPLPSGSSVYDSYRNKMNAVKPFEQVFGKMVEWTNRGDSSSNIGESYNEKENKSGSDSEMKDKTLQQQQRDLMMLESVSSYFSDLSFIDSNIDMRPNRYHSLHEEYVHTDSKDDIMTFPMLLDEDEDGGRVLHDLNVSVVAGFEDERDLAIWTRCAAKRCLVAKRNELLKSVGENEEELEEEDGGVESLLHAIGSGRNQNLLQTITECQEQSLSESTRFLTDDGCIPFHIPYTQQKAFVLDYVPILYRLCQVDLELTRELEAVQAALPEVLGRGGRRKRREEIIRYLDGVVVDVESWKRSFGAVEENVKTVRDEVVNVEKRVDEVVVL